MIADAQRKTEKGKNDGSGNGHGKGKRWRMEYMNYEVT